MQPHPVHLGGRDIPPARHFGADNHLRHQVAPDQRLGVAGDQEVLLGLRQPIRQGGKRPHQPAAAVRGPAGAVRLGGLPGARLPFAAYEIVAADEQRIGVQNLRARRRIVGIAEGQQGVAHERRQQPGHILEPGGVARGLLDGGLEVQLALGVQMLVGPVAEAHGVLFDGGERRPRYLELAHAGDQLVQLGGRQLLRALQVGSHLQQRVEGNHPLRVQNTLDFELHCGARIAVSGTRSGEQIHHALVRGRRGRLGAQQEVQAGSRRGEAIDSAPDGRERRRYPKENRVRAVLGDGALARQNLPQAHQRLEGAGDFAAVARVAQTRDGVCRIQELHDGLVAQAPRFGEHGVLVAVDTVGAHQPVHGGGG